MPTTGLEPVRRFQLRILSPLRLPFRQAGADAPFIFPKVYRPELSTRREAATSTDAVLDRRLKRRRQAGPLRYNPNGVWPPRSFGAGAASVDRLAAGGRPRDGLRQTILTIEPQSLDYADLVGPRTVLAHFHLTLQPGDRQRDPDDAV
jgi:hypothetical protein